MLSICYLLVPEFYWTVKQGMVQWLQDSEKYLESHASKFKDYLTARSTKAWGPKPNTSAGSSGSPHRKCQNMKKDHILQRYIRYII